ncbi:hypothetical protein DFAR_920006 [Desulfarculales bacterium]
MDVHQPLMLVFLDEDRRYAVTQRHGLAEVVISLTLPGTPPPWSPWPWPPAFANWPRAAKDPWPYTPPARSR